MSVVALVICYMLVELTVIVILAVSGDIEARVPLLLLKHRPIRNIRLYIAVEIS